MIGAHDMGGVQGFGRVDQEVDEPNFHAEWETRAFALNLSSGGGRWSIDAGRFAREDTPPGDYLSRSYYEMWLYGLEKMVVQSGMVTTEELEAARHGDHFDAVDSPRLMAANVERVMRAGGSARVDVDIDAPFSVGDRVRARSGSPRGHTRCPGYVSGHSGVVDRDHGVFVFADTNAHGLGEKPQHVYAVRFEAGELWGPDNDGGGVYVDLWDDHLESE